MSNPSETAEAALVKLNQDLHDVVGCGIEQILILADQEQKNGPGEGVELELTPEVDGLDLKIAVHPGYVDFRRGHLGPFVLSRDEVVKLITPPDSQES